MFLRYLKRRSYRTLIQLLWMFYRSEANTGNRVPVLCYHRFLPHFNENNSQVLYVTPEQFEKQMAYLAEEGFNSLSLKEYLSIATGTSPPGLRSVLVTIDDGYCDAYSVAWPIACQYNIKLNLFILPGVQDTAGPYLMGIDSAVVRMHSIRYHDLWRPLNWDEIREMHISGIGIGLHGYTHTALSELEPAAALKAVKKAIQIFQSQLGFQPSVFALPYGNLGSYNKEILQILNRLEFEVVFSTLSGRTALPSNKSPFSRLVVHPWDDLKSIQMRLFGAADLVGTSKRVLYR